MKKISTAQNHNEEMQDEEILELEYISSLQERPLTFAYHPAQNSTPFEVVYDATDQEWRLKSNKNDRR